MLENITLIVRICKIMWCCVLFSFQVGDDDLLVESFSEDEDVVENTNVVDGAPSAIRDLLTRKVELEKREKKQEIHSQRVQVSFKFISLYLAILRKNLDDLLWIYLLRKKPLYGNTHYTDELLIGLNRNTIF